MDSIVRLGAAAADAAIAASLTVATNIEERIFSTAPAVMLVVTSPLLVAYYSGRPQASTADGHLSAKLLSSLLLILLEIIAAALRLTASGMVATTIRSHLTGCVAAAASAVVLHYEHLYSMASSAFMSIYLVISMIQDFAKAKSFLSSDGGRQSDLGYLFMALLAVKFALVLLMEVPKSFQTSTGQVVTSGFWSRTVFDWLSSTVFFGFRNRRSADDLPNLPSDCSSEHAAAVFGANWMRFQGSSNRLLKASVRSLLIPILAGLPAQILYMGFIWTRPFLFRRILVHIVEDHKSIDERNGLIGAFIIINAGVMVSKMLCDCLNSKLAVRAHVMLMGQVIRKNLLRNGTEERKASLAATVRASIDDISNALLGLHDAWSGVIIFGTCMYLLSTVVGNIAFLIISPAVATNVALFLLTKRYDLARNLVEHATELRMEKTKRFLSQVKGIKMMGIEAEISHFIQGLRNAEVAQCKISNRYYVARYFAAILGHTIIKLLLPGTWVFLKGRQAGFDAMSTWTILTISDMMVTSINAFLHPWRLLKLVPKAAITVESFLLLEEETDCRISEPIVTGARHAPLDQYPVQFLDAHIAPHGSNYPVVYANAAIERATLTMVVGPTGSGKTTLLESVIGEATVVQGFVYVELQEIAYCGPIDWIQNMTIRDNIIGENPYDEGWFGTVIGVCMLHDLNEFPDGYLTLAGIQGSNLTREQKQRIAIARGIYARTKIIVMDDILSAVERTMASEILTNLFGDDGLLRNLGTTVIMATQTTDILDAADAIIMVSWDGLGRLEKSRAAINLYAAKYPYIRDDDAISEAESEFGSAARHFRAEPAKKQIKTSLWPQSRLSTIWLCLRSFCTPVFWPWILILAFSTLLERLPDIFLAFWIDNVMDERPWFSGYVLLHLVHWTGTVAWLWICYQHLAPLMSETLHRRLTLTVARATSFFTTQEECENVLGRFGQDMFLVLRELPAILSLFLYSISLALSELGVISSAAPQLAPTMIGTMLITLLILHIFFSRASKQMQFLQQETKEKFSTYLTDTTHGAQHIRAYGWGPTVLKKSSTLLDNSQKLFYYTHFNGVWLRFIIELSVLAISLKLLCLALCGGLINLTTLGPALFVASQTGGVLEFVIENSVALDSSLGDMSELCRFLNETPQENAEDTNVARSIPNNWPHTGEIEFSNVNSEHITSTGSHTGVRNLSIAIEGRTKVGILGASGSGKTSLLLTLLNFLPYTGQITIDGIEISTVPRHFLRSRITSISQDLMQLPCSVRDNMAPWDMGKPMEDRTDDATILQALGQVGLSGHIMRRGGLGAELSDFGLTHAQQQLFALARAVLHKRQTNSKILLIDEPLEGLDSETEDRIQSVMADVFEDCTVLNIANRLSSMDAADVLLEMSGGYLVPDGWGN